MSGGNIDVLLNQIDKRVLEIHDYYLTDLSATTLASEGSYAIRGVIQDCQSALDWTATAVKAKYAAAAKWAPYFPLVKNQADFPAEMDKQIKGLQTNAPNVAAAFERHQPYHPARAELGHLHALARVTKHRDFLAQSRETAGRIEAHGAEAVYAEAIDPHKGGSAHPADFRDNKVYVDWKFHNPPVSVLPTLEALGRLVRAAVEDVRVEAGL